MSHTAEVFWPGNTDIRFFWPDAALTTVVIPLTANIASFIVSIFKSLAQKMELIRPFWGASLGVGNINRDWMSTATDSAKLKYRREYLPFPHFYFARRCNCNRAPHVVKARSAFIGSQQLYGCNGLHFHEERLLNQPIDHQ